MRIPTFGRSNNSATVAKKATEIITQAKASGRSKLIVDVSGNNGGEQNRYFNNFSLLFPDPFPYDALRIRRSDSTAIMAKFLESPSANDSNTNVSLNYQDFLRPDRQRGFSSLAEFLGEEEISGTKLTALHTVNFTKESTAERPIRGHGAALGDINKTLGYGPEDVLIITDGYCHLSCAAFVDLLSHIAKVRTVVFGGRPQLGPIQGIRGVRGGNVVQFSALAELAREVVSTEATNHTTTNLTGDWFTDADRELAKTKLPGFDASFGLARSVNFQNKYYMDNGNLFLQFDYQSAECRLFFTADNVNSPATAWAAAKKAI
ncbi:peptidase S41 family protein ustP [Hirsutella rhossiliensis]